MKYPQPGTAVVVTTKTTGTPAIRHTGTLVSVGPVSISVPSSTSDFSSNVLSRFQYVVVRRYVGNDEDGQPLFRLNSIPKANVIDIIRF